MNRSYGDQLWAIALAFAVFVGTGSLQPAVAGLLFPGGNPHPLAITGSSGIVPLLDTSAGNLHYGDIEFAVFNFAGWAAAFPGANTPNDGLGNKEAFYAFQVIDNGATDGITQFSAGLADLGPLLFPQHFGDGGDDNELVNAGDQGVVAGTGQAPTFIQLTPSALYGAVNGSSVKYNFTGAARLQNETSAVVFYSSPWGPRWDNGSTTSGAGQSRIPAPEQGLIPEGNIPEPSSLALVSLAAIGWAVRRRRSL
jgi:hypothetical protein